MVNLDQSLITDMLRQSMEEGKAPFLRVISNSMAPLVVSGDQVRISATSLDSLISGDVIVIEEGQELLTHRYWGQIRVEEQELIITKGDRPQHFDAPQDADRLVGLVTVRKSDSRLLELTGGAGRWLNGRLKRIAQIDARLFAKAPAARYAVTGQWFEQDGRYASSTRGNLGHRMVRRMLYFVAKMITLAVQPFERPVEGS